MLFGRECRKQFKRKRDWQEDRYKQIKKDDPRGRLRENSRKDNLLGHCILFRLVKMNSKEGCICVCCWDRVSMTTQRLVKTKSLCFLLALVCFLLVYDLIDLSAISADETCYHK